MTDAEYELIPLKNTQSILVNWKFSQGDYDKLVKGHRSNWCVFLRDDIVHVCRIGGEELYRFAIRKASNKVYATDSLEAYIPDTFYEATRTNGWSEERIEQHQTELRGSAVEEVSGLLASYFDISLD